MSIAFDRERWLRVRENYARWWTGELNRPLVHIVLTDAPSDRAEPALPGYGFASFYDLTVPAADIVDRWDYDLSRCRFLGDAFPSVWPNFGPGVAAAFLGARLVNGKDTSWFQPSKIVELDQLRLTYDPANPWLARVRELTQAALDRWQGLVQVGITDLGGTLDILSTFRPGELLLLDLVDRPADVKRVTWDIHRLWWRFYEEFEALLRPVNPGYTAWAPIFSAERYYMLQCDFCYMIGPDMFEEFVKPELTASCDRLTHAFYHLDGVGQLPHLDALLRIGSLKGVQWVPGAGQPDCAHWPQVYRRIREAGKLVQLFGSLETLAAVVSQLGSGEGLILIASAPAGQASAIREFLERFGAA